MSEIRVVKRLISLESLPYDVMIDRLASTTVTSRPGWFALRKSHRRSSMKTSANREKSLARGAAAFGAVAAMIVLSGRNHGHSRPVNGVRCAPPETQNRRPEGV